MKYKISVIIPVKNDKRIKLTLNALLKQKKVKGYEVIVVDSSTGELDEIEKVYADKVRWIHYIQKNGGKRSTVAQVNQAVEEAKGEILTFIDADCIPEDDWLYELTRPILDEEENFVAGFVKSLKEKSQLDNIWDKFSENKYISYCPNMNSAVKNSVFNKIGLYDEVNFNYGWDMDFSWRAIESGYKIRFTPSAIIYHDWGDLNADYRRNLNYGRAKITLYSKHPQQVKQILKTDPYAVKYPLLIILLPLLFFMPLLFPIWLYFLVKDSLKGNFIQTTASNFAYGFGILDGLLRNFFLDLKNK